MVKVNGKIVSQVRSYRKKTQHVFRIGGQMLVLELRIGSIIKGPIYCTLHTQDAAGQLQPIARKQVKFWADLATEQSTPEKQKPSWAKRLLGLGEIILFGFIGFWLASKYGSRSLDFWMALLAIILVVSFIKNRLIASLSRRDGQNKKAKAMPFAVIEDVPLTSEPGVETSPR